MNKEEVTIKTVSQWREALQESARVAVEALAKESPTVGQLVMPLDERSKILGEAIHQIRELVRPTPLTMAFWEEVSWYRKKGTLPVKGKPGECHDPFAEIDAVTANPPMGEVPVDAPKPLSPDAVTEPGEDRHMSYTEAVALLMELARKRSMSVEQVNALQMAAHRLMLRHFQRPRNWAKRREARKAESEVVS